MARANGAASDPVIRQRLARSYAELEILRYNTLRSLSGYRRAGGPARGIDHQALLGQLAPAAWASWPWTSGARPALVAEGFPYELDEFQRTFLFSRSETIYGGSNEIQKNIIGERVLGLPPEPKGTAR